MPLSLLLKLPSLLIPKSREGKYLLSIALLIVALGASLLRLRTYKVLLSAKPAIEQKFEEKVEESKNSREERGRVRTIEKFAPATGSCKPVLVERVIEKDPVVITREVERVSEVEASRSEKPFCGDVRPRKWIVGASVVTAQPREQAILRVGYSFGGRLDLTYGYMLDGPKRLRHRAEAAFRF